MLIGLAKGAHKRLTKLLAQGIELVRPVHGDRADETLGFVRGPIRLSSLCFLVFDRGAADVPAFPGSILSKRSTPRAPCPILRTIKGLISIDAMLSDVGVGKTRKGDDGADRGVLVEGTHSPRPGDEGRGLGFLEHFGGRRGIGAPILRLVSFITSTSVPPRPTTTIEPNRGSFRAPTRSCTPSSTMG